MITELIQLAAEVRLAFVMEMIKMSEESESVTRDFLPKFPRLCLRNELCSSVGKNLIGH